MCLTAIWNLLVPNNNTVIIITVWAKERIQMLFDQMRECREGPKWIQLFWWCLCYLLKTLLSCWIRKENSLHPNIQLGLNKMGAVYHLHHLAIDELIWVHCSHLLDWISSAAASVLMQPTSDVRCQKPYCFQSTTVQFIIIILSHSE